MSALLAFVWFAAPITIGFLSYRWGRRDELAHWCKYACARCKSRVGDTLS